ncbi:hypothetical protein TVAG_140840 [Trichomonas vaginalis G3]|uniref:Uncharacterized protein n=1 Tax=Trichomonas vaginalis (strain ATCC PRA-98 / G3) TaxID=412133 RepID=A2FEQ8_TRIV3|nr:Rabconnectin-3b, isoform A family [Trichomonas vaginalis G3]EAX96595.1 hypothetical protein TVAG_140840 [Trichomonas vaginalis G3]KAI5524094.1 Rabconnectin-3b, isoform A family [Trichomonas vaginalis G3]|eukprot:XP_001309525.1 hypothetical protein [Trichomonas vaginalis G3]
MSNMYEDLYISLISWSNMSLPHVECSAIHTTDLSKKKLRYSFLDDKPVQGVISFGCYSGELIRFIILKDEVKPASVSFAHKTKIVALSDCYFQSNFFSVASLSFDGLFCIWSVQDGICLGKYEKIFPVGCQLMATSGDSIVVSGSFPNVFIFNTSEERVTKILHPHYSFTAGIGIIPSDRSKVLFLMDSKGTVTYASIDPSITQTFKYQLLDPNRVVIKSLPSPSFKFLLTLYGDLPSANSSAESSSPSYFSITDLSSVGFPSITHEYKDLHTATWIDDYTFGVLSYSGSYTQFEINDKYVEGMDKSEEEEYYEDEEEESEENTNCPTEEEEFLQQMTPKSPTSNDTATHIDYLYSQLKDLYPQLRDLSHPDAKIFGRNRYCKIPITKSNLHLEQLYYAQGTFPFGCITSFKKEIIAGFNDTVIFLSNNFDEFSLGQMFEQGPKRTTAQCLNIQNDLVKEIIEGLEDGSISYYDLNSMTYYVQENVHKGRINEICTCGKYLFSAGSDNTLVVTNLETKQAVKTFQHFMSRITQFLRPIEKVRKPFCDYLFCLTEFGAISVIDIEQLDNVFNMTGHDGQVTSIMIHSLSGILIVNAKSLFFWSLHSGNLESILRGNRKEIYLKDPDKNHVEVKPIQAFVNGVVYEQLLFGGNSLRVIDINIKTVSNQISNYLMRVADKSLKETIEGFPNLGLLSEVFSTYVCDFLKKNIGVEYGKHFNICFVGDKGVHTVNLIKQRLHNDIWTFSSEVSSMILAMRIMLSMAMRNHPLFFDTMNDLINKYTISISSNIKYFKNPNVTSLFKYFKNSTPMIINYFMDMVEKYPQETRRRWMNYLQLVEGTTKYRRDLIIGAWIGLGTTVLSTLSDTELKLLAERAQKLSNSQYRTFIPEVLYRCATRFKDIAGVSDIVIRTLITSQNAGRIDLNILFDAAPIGFLKNILQLSNEGQETLAKTLINVIIDIILQGRVRDDILFQMIQTIIGCSKASLTDHINKQLKAIDDKHKWFNFGADQHLIAYGNNSGTLFVTKKIGSAFRSSILSLAKEPLLEVTSDASGNVITVNTKSTIFEIQIKVADDQEHMQLDVVSTKPKAQ